MKKLLLIFAVYGAIGLSQTVISGELAGTLTVESSPYYMVADCEVLDTLIIEPGVDIYVYSGDITFTIYGSIYANGTEDNPISITGFSGEWRGIEFWGINSIGMFSYFELANTYQNAIAVWGNSDITLDNCNINHTGWSYGINIRDACSINIAKSDICNGISVYDCSPVSIIVSETNIYNLSNPWSGIRISEFRILDLIVRDCNISDFSGSGIYLQRTNYYSGEYDIQLISNLIKNNSGYGIEISGGFGDQLSGFVIGNNTIANNNSSGLYLDWGSPNNTPDPLIIANNLVCQNSNLGIEIMGVPANAISFNNIFGNIGGSGYSLPTDYVNTNGDSCDVNSNIYIDPLISNYTLYSLSENSPCIDAGRLIDVFDPDGTFPEIGYWFYDQSGGIEGCMDTTAINYDPNATIPCIDCCVYEEVLGCTYVNALNYNVDATIDDGSCIFEECMDGDLNGDGTVNVLDVILVVNIALGN